jgi:two-component system, sensor histidine kinase PdtaS
VPSSPLHETEDRSEMQKASWQVLLSNSSGARLAQFLLAIAFPLLALALRWALDPILGNSAVFLLFLAACAVPAMAGGLIPGLIAVAISAAAGSFLLGEGHQLMWMTTGQFAELALFLFIGGLQAWWMHVLRSAMRELALAKETEQLLRREMQHRFANYVQSVVSAARLQLRGEADERVQRALATLTQRVQVFADIDEQIRQAEESGGSFAELLKAICRKLTEASNITGIECDVTVEASIQLTPSQMRPLALITNELVTNALKHAFTSPGAGKISLHLRRPNEDWAELEYADTGAPFPPAFSLAQARGSGIRLVQALAEQLGGGVTLSPAPEKVITVKFAMS